jgi:hypothetical protein
MPLIRHLRFLALPCALLAAGAAQAQFADMLKNAVTNAATSAVTSAAANATTKAVNGTINGAVDSVKNPPGERAQPAPAAPPANPAATPAVRPDTAYYCPETEGAPLPALGERPPLYRPEVLWPDAPKCTPRTFSDYTFDQARAQVKAFDKAGAPLCPECVGGRARDSLPAFHLGDGRRKYDLSAAVLALKEGGRVAWQGHRLAGRIELVGEQPIGAFPCRQYRWTLTNKDNEVVAERPGLYCRYSWRDQEPAWHQVI